MAVDKDGNLYVVDFGNNRVQKFAPVTESSSTRENQADEKI